MKGAVIIRGCIACLLGAMPGGTQMLSGTHYKVLPPLSQSNLILFPVVADVAFDTDRFITLDEGVRSGQVVITERAGRVNEFDQRDLDQNSLVRPRTAPRFSGDDGIWSERPPQFPRRDVLVNELSLTSHSDKSLLLLAGEIVVGGKQGQVVSRDRIVPAHSDTIAVSVFRVEPHRWEQASAPEWDQFAILRAAALKSQRDSLAIPMDHRFDKLREELKADKAVGAVVALDGELIWVDVFASPSLFDRYWPKWIRSYAADAFRLRAVPPFLKLPPTVNDGQDFLDTFNANWESINSELDLYRDTELIGYDFHAFILTSLLPDTGFNVHIAKMKRATR